MSSLTLVRRSYLSLSGVCVVWGTIPAIVRQVDLPSPAIVLVRLTSAAVLLGIAVGATGDGRGKVKLALRDRGALATAGLLGVHWLALFAAYQRAPVGTVILITYLAPIGVAALAPRVLDEHHEPHTRLAVALGAGGFCLLATPSVRGGAAAGLLLAAAAAATFVALMLVAKPAAQRQGGLVLAFVQMAGGAVIVAPVALLAGWGAPRPAWLLVVLVGAFHTAVAYVIYLRVLGQVPVAHAAVLMYLEPVAAVLVAWIVLAETPAVLTLIGGSVVVGAGVLLVAGSRDHAEAAGVPG